MSPNFYSLILAPLVVLSVIFISIGTFLYDNYWQRQSDFLERLYNNITVMSSSFLPALIQNDSNLLQYMVMGYQAQNPDLVSIQIINPQYQLIAAAGEPINRLDNINLATNAADPSLLLQLNNDYAKWFTLYDQVANIRGYVLFEFSKNRLHNILYQQVYSSVAVLALIVASIVIAVATIYRLIYVISKRNRELSENNKHLTIARQQAEDASKAKSQFLANMSHELRTPLNAIIGYADIIREEVTNQPHLLEDLVKIQSAGKHLLGLINDVLDLAKIEAGKMEVYREWFELKPLIEEVVAIIQPALRKNKNLINIDYTSEINKIYSDVIKTRQILFNLIANACKFTENGKIHVTVTTHAEKGVQITITDTGIGMSQEQLDKLFIEFNQADNSSTRKYGGTGLGLAITKDFINLLGGDIAVQSKAGQGSTFTVWLPEKSQHPSKEAQAIIREEHNITYKKQNNIAGKLAALHKDQKRALIIADDLMTQEVMTSVLTREEWVVDTTANGQEAMHLMQNFYSEQCLPKAVILDIHLPYMSGFEIIDQFKQNPEWHKIKLIVFTAHDLKPSEKQWLISHKITAFTKSQNNPADIVTELQKMS